MPPEEFRKELNEKKRACDVSAITLDSSGVAHSRKSESAAYLRGYSAGLAFALGRLRAYE